MSLQCPTGVCLRKSLLIQCVQLSWGGRVLAARLVLARCDFRRGRQDAAPPTPTVLITFFFVSFSHSAQLSFTLLQVRSCFRYKVRNKKRCARIRIIFYPLKLSNFVSIFSTHFCSKHFVQHCGGFRGQYSAPSLPLAIGRSRPPFSS